MKEQLDECPRCDCPEWQHSIAGCTGCDDCDLSDAQVRGEERLPWESETPDWAEGAES